MSELLRVLVLYYACDAAATERHPTPAEWARCMGHYADIKRHFAQGETGPDGNRVGYLGFKAWEAENPSLVADLRRRSQR
jgi:hypothetical protein